MNTRLLIIIGIATIVILGIVVPNYWLEFDDFSIFLCGRWFDSHYQCNAIWIDAQCNLPGSGCIFPEKTPFEQFLEKKAITAFNLKLDEYRIISKVQSAHPAYSTGNHKSFMAQAVENDGTRYYLSTSFIADESLDKINVEIYKIISEKCDLNRIGTGIGCESEYLETIDPNLPSPLAGWNSGNSKNEINSSKLIRNEENQYCNSINEVQSDQCYSLEEIVFVDARKDWTVYPGGAGWMPPNNSNLIRIYKDVDFGISPLNFTAMLDDRIFVNKCELNGGVWNYVYHDCEGLWQICEEIGGIHVNEDITPTCTGTEIINDDPLTFKGCNSSALIRVSCVFEYEN